MSERAHRSYRYLEKQHIIIKIDGRRFWASIEGEKID